MSRLLSQGHAWVRGPGPGVDVSTIHPPCSVTVVLAPDAACRQWKGKQSSMALAHRFWQWMRGGGEGKAGSAAAVDGRIVRTLENTTTTPLLIVLSTLSMAWAPSSALENPSMVNVRRYKYRDEALQSNLDRP